MRKRFGSGGVRRVVLSGVLVAVAIAGCVVARGDAAIGAGEVWRALEKLRVLGSVLYIAAHPDDENTAMLAYFAGGRQLRTAYLSLTRGNGGQNLIGPEQAPLLGVIRTQELLAARALDGAEQYFTRAVDFGYSKSAEESLARWGHEEVLADVVRVLRTFKPDVVITRFPASGDAGHGHHTASAILAAEAFAAAGDPARFPDQVSVLGTWRPRRLFWNAWRPQIEGRAPGMPQLLTLDLGVFDAVRGESYAEVAARARSMHKSQGFGAAPRRGTLPNYLELLAGDPAQKDPLEGIDTTWGRVPGGQAVEAALVEAQKAFDVRRLSAVVPGLLAARRVMASLPASHWVEVKRRELDQLIVAASGVWVEAVAQEPSVAPGDTVSVSAVVINRGPLAWVLRTVSAAGSKPLSPNQVLAVNQPISIPFTVAVDGTEPVTAPEWLREPPSAGLYRVAPAVAIEGAPQPPLATRFTLSLDGEEVEVAVPVVYRTADPVRGERLRLVSLLPPVTAAVENGVVIFPNAQSRTVRVRLRAMRAARGVLRFDLPPPWRSEPAELAFSLASRGDETLLEVTMTPPAQPSTATARLEVEVDGRRSAWGSFELDYDHIPPTTVLLPAQVKVVHEPVRIAGRRVGYVMGPGDEVPDVLRQLGYEVTLLLDADLDSGDLEKLDAVVTGVRAFNTRQRLAAAQRRLLSYVEAGGTLVVQYNTAHGLLTDVLGPYSLVLGRDRVTVEDAPVTILVPDHPVLSFPNRITRADFEGWVQERGLYFPASWDDRYEAPLAMQDPGEKALTSGLLVARHGQGCYVYTPLAFFRQLPAGVPGALRLFANLLAGGRP